ncbi:MAG: response regulator transcription factor [Candidatus Limnocylindrales bacterium]
MNELHASHGASPGSCRQPPERIIVRGGRPLHLTPREFQAVAAVVTQGSYKEAAAALGITEETVKNHLAHAHERTGLTTVQLVHTLRHELALYIATRGGS